jgi:hypothetical protein
MIRKATLELDRIMAERSLQSLVRPIILSRKHGMKVSQDGYITIEGENCLEKRNPAHANHHDTSATSLLEILRSILGHGQYSRRSFDDELLSVSLQGGSRK